MGNLAQASTDFGTDAGWCFDWFWCIQLSTMTVLSSGSFSDRNSLSNFPQQDKVTPKPTTIAAWFRGQEGSTWGMVIPLLLRILIIGIHGTHRHVHGNSKMHSWMPLGEEIPQVPVQINYWYLQLSVFWRGVSSCQQSWKCSTNQLKVLTGLHGGHNLIGNWTISSSKLWFANNTKMQQAIFNVWWVDQEPTSITKLEGF